MKHCPKCGGNLVQVNEYGILQCQGCRGVYDPEIQTTGKPTYLPMSGLMNISGIIGQVGRKCRSVRQAIEDLNLKPLLITEPGYQGRKGIYTSDQVALLREYFKQPKGMHQTFILTHLATSEPIVYHMGDRSLP